MKATWKNKPARMPATIIKTATFTSAVLGNRAKKFTRKNMTESVIESKGNEKRSIKSKSAKRKTAGHGSDGKTHNLLSRHGLRKKHGLSMNAEWLNRRKKNSHLMIRPAMWKDTLRKGAKMKKAIEVAKTVLEEAP